eukprot:2139760-Amphidinium_carterae.2
MSCASAPIISATREWCIRWPNCLRLHARLGVALPAPSGTRSATVKRSGRLSRVSSRCFGPCRSIVCSGAALARCCCVCAATLCRLNMCRSMCWATRVCAATLCRLNMCRSMCWAT